MSAPEINWLARYRPWRRHAEVGFWVVVLLAQVMFNTGVLWLDQQRAPGHAAAWELLTWEASSALGIGLLIPLVVAFERRFPLRLATLPRHVGWHWVASVAFCLAHVAIMVALRKGSYAALGQTYQFDGWVGLVYEYLKDSRTYLLILVALLSYRLLLLRLQGEARVLDAPDAPLGEPLGALAGAPLAPPAGPSAPPAPGQTGPPTPPRPERFLVRKLRREFLVAANDIAWLQAQGNYVGLHVQGHDYLLRSTLADFLGLLEPTRFVRVHRSYAVNLDQVAEIEPLEGGEARLRMKDGSQVPCSRRYRSALGTPAASAAAAHMA